MNIKNFKLPLITASVAFVIGIILAGIVGWYIVRKKDRSIDGYQSAYKEQQAQTTFWRNKQGQEVAEKLVAQAKAKELLEAYPKLASELSRQFDIKIRNLASYMQTNFAAKGSGNATIIPLDTGLTLLDHPIGPKWKSDKHGSYYLANGDTVRMRADSFEPFAIFIHDGYLDMQTDIYGPERAPYHYTYSDTVTTVHHFKKKWFLGKRTLYSSTALSNPNAHVVGTTSIQVKEFRDRRWGIGPSISYGIGADGKLQTNIGVSVHWSVIKF